MTFFFKIGFYYVLHRYRSEPDFVPELSLVLEVDGEIIGHVMYAWSHIDPEPYFVAMRNPRRSRSTTRNSRRRKSSCSPGNSNPVIFAPQLGELFLIDVHFSTSC